MSRPTDEQRRFPAEWEPQSAVQLTWPHADSDWRASLDDIEPVFAQIGAEIAKRQPLLVVCLSPEHQANIRNQLIEHGAPADSLLFGLARSNDTWARDYGPLTIIVGDQARIIDFRFNGWGGKFVATHDDKITAQLARTGVYGNSTVERADLVLEGGAVESDGQGTLLATRHAVVTDTRNPGFNQTQIERQLRNLLGIKRFLWLDQGVLTGDDTDGHIDTLARFCDPRTILYSTCATTDPDFPALERMHRELVQFRQIDGTRYRLIPLPPPGTHRDPTGRRLPASYANFLIINHAVLAPVYGHAHDNEATSVLKDCFPGRRIIPIDCGPVIRQNGSLHCLTMQYPQPLQLACCH